jgi:hypothetical protein
MTVKRHIVHGFLEIDVTVPGDILKKTSGSNDRPLWFTGFIIASFSRAIAASRKSRRIATFGTD